MGHSSDFIALESGIAGGAEHLILHDKNEDIDLLADRLDIMFKQGKRHAIVVVAEGKQPGCSFDISKIVSERIGVDSRVCVLGHTQRGGSPTARDRVLAAKLGVSAVQALVEGMSGVMTGEIKREIVYQPISTVISRHPVSDPRMIRLSAILSG